MKLAYVANVRIPTEKAHGAQIMQMCKAFAAEGAEVCLIVPKRNNSLIEDPFAYYGITPSFSIRSCSTIDALALGPLGFLLQAVTFGCSARKDLEEFAPDVIVGRGSELALLTATATTKAPLIWETHTGEWGYFAKRLAKKVIKIITISQGLADFYRAKGIPAEKIVVAHDGIDLEAFATPESKQQARERLGLPQDAKVVMYLGRLDGWKGTNTLFEAAAHVPEAFVVVVGGEDDQVHRLRSQYPSIRFLGYRPYRELANNQAAADVLVLPNTAKEVISERFTSPLKLFSYMASSVPIVASDLPSLREVLTEQATYFVAPDNAEALAGGIKKALTDTGALEKARAAKAAVQAYDWRVRARLLLNALPKRA